MEKYPCDRCGEDFEELLCFGDRFYCQECVNYLEAYYMDMEVDRFREEQGLKGGENDKT